MSADNVISGTGESVQGYNLFAYCFNNPVNMDDQTGNWPKWIEKAANWLNKNIVTPVAGFCEAVSEDIRNYSPNNQDESAVLSANYFSNYKGALVVNTPLSASFSFGVIGISQYQQDADILKHEYGHFLQMKNKGIFKYTTEVAIPSITINILDRKEKLPYDYYSYPWEAEANVLGGAMLFERNKPKLPQGGYNSYRDLLVLFFK